MKSNKNSYISYENKDYKDYILYNEDTMLDLVEKGYENYFSLKQNDIPFLKSTVCLMESKEYGNPQFIEELHEVLFERLPTAVLKDKYAIKSYNSSYTRDTVLYAGQYFHLVRQSEMKEDFQKLVDFLYHIRDDKATLKIYFEFLKTYFFKIPFKKQRLETVRKIELPCFVSFVEKYGKRFTNMVFNALFSDNAYYFCYADVFKLKYKHSYEWVLYSDKKNYYHNGKLIEHHEFNHFYDKMQTMKELFDEKFNQLVFNTFVAHHYFIWSNNPQSDLAKKWVRAFIAGLNIQKDEVFAYFKKKMSVWSYERKQHFKKWVEYLIENCETNEEKVMIISGFSFDFVVQFYQHLPKEFDLKRKTDFVRNEKDESIAEIKNVVNKMVSNLFQIPTYALIDSKHLKRTFFDKKKVAHLAFFLKNIVMNSDDILRKNIGQCIYNSVKERIAEMFHKKRDNLNNVIACYRSLCILLKIMQKLNIDVHPVLFFYLIYLDVPDGEKMNIKENIKMSENINYKTFNNMKKIFNQTKGLNIKSIMN